MTCNSIRRTLCNFAVAFLVFGILAAHAQAPSAPRPRIVRPIDNGTLIRLPANTHPLALPQFDRGSAPLSMPAERLILVLRRAPDAEARLQAFLESVQNANSPDFRKFLTPEQFGERFGISGQDLAAVEEWLQTHGLQVVKVNKGRTAIEFSGAVGQVEQAFHTSIHSFLIHGVQHWANTGDPSIPAALAPVVAGVASLNDFKPRPLYIRGPRGAWNQSERLFTPNLTLTSGTTRYLFVGPGDAATIYNSPNSLNTRIAAGQARYDGSGVTIGLAENTWMDYSGFYNYRSFFGLPSSSFSIVTDGVSSNLDRQADQTEALLDTELAGALAPGARIVMYTAGDTLFESGLFLAIYRAIDENKVNILSVSFGACESDIGAAGNLQILNTWEQAAAQGITVLVSTGDSGSAGCDNPNTQPAASGGLGVNGLASTPFNIAVGGTDFDGLRSAFSTYVGSTNSGNYTSALGYIPENPWNDSTRQNGLLSANTPAHDSTGATNIVAGGGGASSLGAVDSNGQPTAYPKPLWQQGFAPSNTDSVRDLPDLSLLAATGNYGATWAVCDGSDCTGSSPSIHGVGGTSASAPALAGVLALVNQKIGASVRLGQANWVLYKLAQTTPSVFHPITTGNISVYCAAGSPNCASNHFLTGYNAGAGYNMATGLGSVDVSALVNSWSSVALAPTTTGLALDQTTFTHGDPVHITVGVSPSAATGDVAIVNDAGKLNLGDFNSGHTGFTLANGAASGDFSQFPGGTYNVYASYSGDGAHAASISPPVQVTVSSENSGVLFSAYYADAGYHLLNAGGATLPLGSFVSLNARPIGASQASNPNPAFNATGTITFSDTINGSAPINYGNISLDSTGVAEGNTTYLPAGSHSLTASYAGDYSYKPSTSPPIVFTVSKAPTTLALTADSTTVASSSVKITAVVGTGLPLGSFSEIGGAITLTDTTNNAVIGTIPIWMFDKCPTANLACASGTPSFYSDVFTLGANSITATYSGDNNFTGSSAPAPLSVTCSLGCSNAGGQFLRVGISNLQNSLISSGQSTTATVIVYPHGGFTGPVNLTCSSVVGIQLTDIHAPTCAFSSAQVNVTDTNAVTSTLTIRTTAPTTSARRGPSGAVSWYATGGSVLAAVLLLGLPVRRNWRRIFLVLALFVLVTTWVSACGGGGGSTYTPPSGGGTTVPGTTADDYTVTVRATDAATGTLTAESYFNVTVN